MKLFVVGCSFSDYQFGKYSPEDSTYGYNLKELLKVPYIHHASGIGSNFRMWRKIYNEINTGNLTSKDILIVQYTDITRNEFFSNYILSKEVKSGFIESYKNDEAQKQITEPYYDGRIIKYKHREEDELDKIKFTKEERNFLKLFQNFFISKEFSKEQFDYHHFMFQNMLAFLKIKTVFLLTNYLHEEHVDFIDSFYISKFNIEKFTQTPEYRRTKNDRGHLSQLGHEVLSNNLYQIGRAHV